MTKEQANQMGSLIDHLIDIVNELDGREKLLFLNEVRKEVDDVYDHISQEYDFDE